MVNTSKKQQRRDAEQREYRRRLSERARARAAEGQAPVSSDPDRTPTPVDGVPVTMRELVGGAR